MALSVKLPRKQKKLGSSASKMSEIKVAGPEPILTDLSALSEGEARIALIRAYSWYNHFYTHKEAIDELLVPYLNNSKMFDVLKAINILPFHKVPTTLCYHARMLSNGTVLPEHIDNQFGDQLISLVNLSKQRRSSGTDVVSIRERVEASAREMIGDIDEYLDQLDVMGYQTSPSFAELIRRLEIKGPQAKIVADHLQRLLDEIEQYASDPDVKQAYQYMNATRRKQYTSALKSMLVDLGVVVTATKVAAAIKRKPRVVKDKTAATKLKQFKCKSEDTTFKLVSVNPTTIVGSSVVWTYNTAQKKLAMYCAPEGGKLDVSKSSIVGFDPALSAEKRCQKVTTIQQLAGGTKAGMKRSFEAIASAVSVPSGRVGSETLVFRVFK